MPPIEEIDNLDAAILRELIADSRKNFDEVAKAVNVSKNTVRNHFDEMKNKGVIVGATVQINYKKLGYQCVAALLLEVHPSQVENIMALLKEIPDIFGPFKSTSRINVRAVFALESISKLEQIKEMLRRKLAVKEVGANIWTNVWFLPRNLSLIYPQPASVKSSERIISDSLCKDLADVDDLDMRIMRRLSEDGRISFRKLSRELGTSTDTVARRYKKLKENGTIVNRIQINPKKIGYQGVVNFYVQLAPNSDSTAFIRKVMKMPDVFYIMKSVGDYHLGIMLMVKSTQDILQTGELIGKMQGLNRAESIFSEVSDRWPLPRTYSSTT
ncbi:MAG: Lrp/AsnC family transcriptional regulator [Candidatus Bathyarchaeota archaeon]|nr:Lrp/AsnC family transcriptional regulator [Candidatus Bathyarchaeota archaeon]